MCGCDEKWDDYTGTCLHVYYWPRLHKPEMRSYVCLIHEQDLTVDKTVSAGLN